jgi:hypothetical protein
MKNFVAKFNGLAIAASFVLLTAGAVSVPTESAHAWWQCDPGYTLQLKSSNSKARCYKAAVINEKSTNPCPKVLVPGTNVKVGSTKKKNYSGTADKCVVLQSGGFNVPVTCSFGYSYVKKSGWDKCRKTVSAKEKMVSKNTN